MRGKIHSKGFSLDAESLRSMSLEETYQFAGIKQKTNSVSDQEDTIVEDWSTLFSESANGHDRPLPVLSQSETVSIRTSLPCVKKLVVA